MLVRTHPAALPLILLRPLVQLFEHAHHKDVGFVCTLVLLCTGECEAPQHWQLHKRAWVSHCLHPSNTTIAGEADGQRDLTSSFPRTPASSTVSLAAAASTGSSVSHPPCRIMISSRIYIRMHQLLAQPTLGSAQPFPPLREINMTSRAPLPSSPWQYRTGMHLQLSAVSTTVHGV